MTKVFISGSISTNKLPSLVQDSLTNIINNEFDILVGDAKGIDEQVQNFCRARNYSNVTIYSIYEEPRHKIDHQTSQKYIKTDCKSTRERERQKSKDEAMTCDSDFSLVIWDGKSLGSYTNILRALSSGKKVKVFLTKTDRFLEKDKINENEILFYYRDKNGYSASEVVDELAKHCGFDYDDKIFTDRFFKDTRTLNTFLLKNSVIEKVEVSENKSIYQPTEKHMELFFIDKYRGQIKGVKFKNQFIDWIEKYVKNAASPEQGGFAF